jgi:prolyl-tRNA synthetase
MSPFGLEGKINVVLDSSIDVDSSYIVGANEEDFHVSGFTPSRDIENFRQGDLRLAKEGDLTKDGHKVAFRRGIEVGHIFQLGDKYTKSMKATVLDQNGKAINPLMGCYGIGVTRTMASAIEQSHDEDGIIWPKSIAPYSVYFGKIGKKEETINLCEEIYKDLKENSIEVLFDDRGMGPGPMFKDADLLGLPLRVILGERDYEKDQTLEIKVRKTKETVKIKKENLAQKIKELLKEIN